MRKTESGVFWLSPRKVNLLFTHVCRGKVQANKHQGTFNQIALCFITTGTMVAQLMLAVQYTEGCGSVFDGLRDRKLLYSAYRYYTDEDVAEIVSGDFFSSVEQVHPVFSALIAKPDCSEPAKEKVAAYIESVRKEQRFETVAWELGYDNSGSTALYLTNRR
ncbi:MAG: hypothetical protein LUH20_04310 [Lachnospiraceae bacterium]|nr:hypothetical protein [Lachnospiraceae bacterium]